MPGIRIINDSIDTIVPLLLLVVQMVHLVIKHLRSHAGAFAAPPLWSYQRLIAWGEDIEHSFTAVVDDAKGERSW